jgi:hypothetical protein
MGPLRITPPYEFAPPSLRRRAPAKAASAQPAFGLFVRGP